MEKLTKFAGKYRIQSHRCKNWDYASEGIYFITIRVKHGNTELGIVRDNQMILNEFGNIVQRCWMKIPLLYPHISLDEFIIMPDHLHGILHIGNENVCRDVSLKRLYKKNHFQHSYQGYNPHMSQISAHSGSLSVVIRMFKGACTKQIRQFYPAFEWQRNYHDHIIQSEYELDRIQTYIQNNPKNWRPV